MGGPQNFNPMHFPNIRSSFFFFLPEFPVVGYPNAQKLLISRGESVPFPRPLAPRPRPLAPGPGVPQPHQGHLAVGPPHPG